MTRPDPRREVTAAVAVALGLDPKRVQSVTLSFGLCGPAHVLVGQTVNSDEAEEIASMLRSYDITLTPSDFQRSMDEAGL